MAGRSKRDCGGLGSGGSRPSAGREAVLAELRRVGRMLYLSVEDYEYSARWGGVGGRMSLALRQLIDRARKFWPNGELF